MRLLIMVQLIFFVAMTEALAQFRDPTEPLVSDNAFEGVLGQDASKINASFNLQSILLSKARRLTTINGKLLSVGSEIDGARVLAIDKNRVILLQGERKITLYLFDNPLWTQKK